MFIVKHFNDAVTIAHTNHVITLTPLLYGIYLSVQGSKQMREAAAGVVVESKNTALMGWVNSIATDLDIALEMSPKDSLGFVHGTGSFKGKRVMAEDGTFVWTIGHDSEKSELIVAATNGDHLPPMEQVDPIHLTPEGRDLQDRLFCNNPISFAQRRANEAASEANEAAPWIKSESENAPSSQYQQRPTFHDIQQRRIEQGMFGNNAFVQPSLNSHVRRLGGTMPDERINIVPFSEADIYTQRELTQRMRSKNAFLARVDNQIPVELPDEFSDLLNFDPVTGKFYIGAGFNTTRLQGFLDEFTPVVPETENHTYFNVGKCYEWCHEHDELFDKLSHDEQWDYILRQVPDLSPDHLKYQGPQATPAVPHEIAVIFSNWCNENRIMTTCRGQVYTLDAHVMSLKKLISDPLTEDGNYFDPSLVKKAHIAWIESLVDQYPLIRPISLEEYGHVSTQFIEMFGDTGKDFYEVINNLLRDAPSEPVDEAKEVSDANISQFEADYHEATGGNIYDDLKPLVEEAKGDATAITKLILDQVARIYVDLKGKNVS